MRKQSPQLSSQIHSTKLQFTHLTPWRTAKIVSSGRKVVLIPSTAHKYTSNCGQKARCLLDRCAWWAGTEILEHLVLWCLICRESKKKNSKKWTHIHRSSHCLENRYSSFGKTRLSYWLAKKLWQQSQKHNSAASNTADHHHRSIQLTMISLRLQRRNYKFSGKCLTGRPTAQTSEVFIGDCIQIFKYPKPMLETRPDSFQTQVLNWLPSTDSKDSDSERRR
jgi:hypothetical protein